MKISGRKIVVTGASRGIGQATARALAPAVVDRLMFRTGARRALP
jgi:NAD(P)-dependent dehydrogenase (short-subunit alcohol dehydrogenase family)